MEEILGLYSRVDNVSLVVESVFADPKAGSFDYGQDACFLAGSGAAFELAQAVCVLSEYRGILGGSRGGCFTSLVSLLLRRRPL